VTAPDPNTGLCPSCLHARRVPSARGSEFLLCARSRQDPLYPKYPCLPVTNCPGYEQRPPSGAALG
jgi:hypothetical protein